MAWDPPSAQNEVPINDGLLCSSVCSFHFSSKTLVTCKTINQYLTAPKEGAGKTDLEDGKDGKEVEEALLNFRSHFVGKLRGTACTHAYLTSSKLYAYMSIDLIICPSID